MTSSATLYPDNNNPQPYSTNNGAVSFVTATPGSLRDQQLALVVAKFCVEQELEALRNEVFAIKSQYVEEDVEVYDPDAYENDGAFEYDDAKLDKAIAYLRERKNLQPEHQKRLAAIQARLGELRVELKGLKEGLAKLDALIKAAEEVIVQAIKEQFGDELGKYIVQPVPQGAVGVEENEMGDALEVEEQQAVKHSVSPQPTRPTGRDVLDDFASFALPDLRRGPRMVRNNDILLDLFLQQQRCAFTDRALVEAVLGNVLANMQDRYARDIGNLNINREILGANISNIQTNMEALQKEQHSLTTARFTR